MDRGVGTDTTAPPPGRIDPPHAVGAILRSEAHPARCETQVTVERLEPPKERVAISRATNPCDPQHFDESLTNVMAATAQRVERYQPKFKPGPQLRARLEKVRDSIIERVLTKKKIYQWLDEHPTLRSAMSKAWSDERAQRAVETLRGLGFDVRITHEASIKDEVLPNRGKAPRLIISCGDQGQLCALIHVACFEGLLYDHFEKRSIKHRAKADALGEVSGRAKQEEGFVKRYLEGDGKAWDRTITPRLRELLENPLLEHVANTIYARWDAIGSLSYWASVDIKDRKKPIRRLVYRKGSRAHMFLEAFRASGDRGTSCLNWVVNYSCWLAVLVAYEDIDRAVTQPNWRWFRPAPHYLRNDKRTLSTRRKMFMDSVYEGDDSFVMISTDRPLEDIEAAWASLGFEMKLFERRPGSVVTFVGNECLVKEEGLSDLWLPQIARNLTAAAEQRDGGGDPHQHSLACAVRAQGYKRYPPLALHYLAIAKSCRDSNTLAQPVAKATQYAWFGNYNPDRRLEPEVYELPAVDYHPDAEALVAAATGEAPDRNAVDALMTGSLAAEWDKETLRRILPRSWIE